MVDTTNKEKNSIEIIKEFKNRTKGNKNICAFSDGKDSIVLYHLMKRSGIEFIPIYSPPSVDPPEVRYHIQKHYPEIYIQPYEKSKDGQEITMWYLLSHRALPPTRRMRYCCDVLKERTGEEGDTVYIGVRGTESKDRKKLGAVTFYKGKNMIRPIFNWTDEEIWSYIIKNNLQYNPLYDQGWNRIGCIGCPLNSKSQKRELASYPKYKENYLRAFEKMLEYRKSKGMETQWKTGEDVYRWWIGEVKKQESQIEGQCSMFGD
jgi:phosphoadenosine phosphosulfate reductase